MTTHRASSRRGRRRGVAGALVLMGFFAAGCADDDTATHGLDLSELTVDLTDEVSMAVDRVGDEDDTFVGAVDGELFVAVTALDGEFSVYLCDGDEVARWLTTSDGLPTTASDDDLTVTIETADDVVTGTVEFADGDPMAFSARPAAGDAGLYQGTTTIDGVEHRGAWIVLDDGRQQGWWGPWRSGEEEEELQM